jgi:hypothetical protein
LCCVVLCCVVLCCVVLCCVVLCCVVLCCVVLCCVVLCCVVLCCAVLCCAVLCCAVLCCAVLCCAVLCCAVLCCGALCSVVLAPGQALEPSQRGMADVDQSGIPAEQRVTGVAVTLRGMRHCTENACCLNVSHCLPLLSSLVTSSSSNDSDVGRRGFLLAMYVTIVLGNCTAAALDGDHVLWCDTSPCHRLAIPLL